MPLNASIENSLSDVYIYGGVATNLYQGINIKTQKIGVSATRASQLTFSDCD